MRSKINTNWFLAYFLLMITGCNDGSIRENEYSLPPAPDIDNDIAEGEVDEERNDLEGYSIFKDFNEYTLSDFNLRSDIESWELLQLNKGDANKQFYKSYIAYDNSLLSQVEPGMHEDINFRSSLGSNIGFLNICLPVSCPVFGLLKSSEYGLSPIYEFRELLPIFDLIDTPAEVHFLINSNGISVSGSEEYYIAEQYKEDENGYYIIAKWDTLCATKGRDLLYVDNNALIYFIERIETLTREYCI